MTSHSPTLSISSNVDPLDAFHPVEAHIAEIIAPEKTSINASKKGEKDLEHDVVVTSASVDDSVDEYPDGGVRAWLVVLGTVLSGFATFGFVNSWGVFQSYYEQNLLQGTSPSTIAWIGSIQYALVFFPALFTGRLFDIGIFKVPFAIASTVIVACCFIIAECTKYWHFLLCQGILLGVSSGLVFGPSMAILGHWFKRRRGLALGITATGSSIGGTVLPIAARRLIGEVGFKWTMRIIGFILLFALSIPNLTLTRRLPPRKADGGIFNFGAFKSPVFSVYCLAIWVSFLGLYTMLTYIDISAIQIGVSPEFSFYLVAITNAASGLGRLCSGLMVDKAGPINFYAPMTTIAGVLTYAWPFARTQQELIAISVLYGFSSGAFVSTFILPVYGMGEIDDVGRRTGTVMSIAAIGALIGPPISGAINDASGGFEAVGYYAGTMILVSVALLLLTRHLVLRQWRGRY
ncbi:MFS general substrate transporter [Marasmius fiardii PR-910]|nr:MFS general substrate transporter [Marasmius fiardii PR-910]